MSWIDFAAVKCAIIPVDELLRRGWQPVQRVGVSWRGPCPFCSRPGSRSRKLSVNLKGWKCHSCGRKGDVIRLVCGLDQVEPYEAASRLLDWHRVILPRPGMG